MWIVGRVELGRRKRFWRWWCWLWKHIGLEEGKGAERAGWAKLEQLRARWRALPEWMQKLEGHNARKFKDDLVELEALIADLEATAANPEERLGPYGESTGDI